MLRLIYGAVIISIIVFVRTESEESRDELFGHVTRRNENCSLPCQRIDNGSCVDDCSPQSYCDSYFNTCVGCPRHCLQCTSSDTCQTCEDDLIPVGAGCEGSCMAGHYYSPYSTQCVACSSNCLNCTGLNQCEVCSHNYTLFNGTAQQLCVRPCSNGLFYNKTSDHCEACIKHCRHCLSSMSCVECEDGYVFSEDLCILATITTQSTATPTTSAATPTQTAQPKSHTHDKEIYIISGVVGGVVTMVILTMMIVIIVLCYRRKKKNTVDFSPLLHDNDDDDDDDS